MSARRLGCWGELPHRRLQLICLFFVSFSFLDRRGAESALSAEFIPGEVPLLGPEASSNPMLTSNDWCGRMRLH